MLNINLILSANIIKIDKKVVENLEHQVYADEQNEIFNLNEEISVEEYIKNITILTVYNDTFNEDGKGFFEFIRELVQGFLDRIRNPR